jgi:hypothetical protein
VPDDRPAYEQLLATYTALVGAAAWVLWRRGRPIAVPPPSETAVMGVAIFKLSRLVTKEKVLRPVREPFVEDVEPGAGSELNSKPARRGLKGAVGELLTCPFCISVWISTALMVLYAVAPRAARLVASAAAATAVADVSQYGFARLRSGAD